MNVLEHGAKVFYRFNSEGRYSTAYTYEDALKIFVKCQMKCAKKDDHVIIKSLYDKNRDGFSVKDDYIDYDLQIKAFNVEFAKDFKAYLGQRMKAKNSVGIHFKKSPVNPVRC